MHRIQSTIQAEPEPAFILHTRPYRETSALVDFFSRHYGRFRAVARGVRGAKKNSPVLTPYTPLLITWSGKSDLKTVKTMESSGPPILLQGDRLYCGFYLNELLLKLLAEHDTHEKLFDRYLNTLTLLASTGAPLESSLRTFEFSLLEDIGYAIVLDSDAETGDSIVPDRWYWFDPSIGFVLKQGVLKPRTKSQTNAANWFLGAELLAIHAEQFHQTNIASAAKRLVRLAFRPHIGDSPLRSRALFK
jgi:DNA repair protein RecO (recombination protein O)